MKVEVYRNLHKKCYSVRDCKTGRVILHKDVLMLENVKYVVRQAGRERVLKENRKNVHAFVRGKLIDELPAWYYENNGHWDFGSATYNPYKYKSFVDNFTGKPVYESNLAILFPCDFNKGSIKWYN